MRKHSVVWLAAVLGLLMASGWAGEVTAEAPAGDLARVVSEDAFFFAEVSDAKGVWADFEQSGLRAIIRTLPAIELPLALLRFTVPQFALQMFGIQWDEFVGTHARRFGLVLSEPPGQGRPGEAEPCFLLDASAPRGALEKLLKGTVEPTLLAKAPGLAFAEEQHGGVTLRITKLGPKALAYAFVDDVLVLGAPPAVKKLVGSRGQRPLSANATFLKVREKLAVPKGLVTYLNIKRVLADVRPQLDANPQAARLLDDLGLSSLQWAAFSSTFEARGVRDKIFLYTGERKVGLMRLLTSLTPGAATGALALPKECPIFAALAFKDGSELWQGILKFFEEGGHAEHLAKFDEARKAVLLEMGINLDDDFIGALGGEIFVAANPDFIAQYPAKGRAPTLDELPIILGARVAKPEALKTTIHRFLSSQPIVGQGVERKTETYHETEINTLAIPGRETPPAYAFVGDHLLIARDKGILQKCIDARGTTNDSLSALPRFAPLLSKMPAKGNGLLYVDLEALLVAVLKAQQPQVEDAPPPPGLALISELRSVYGAMVAEQNGLLLETYSRPGLLGLAALTILVAPGPARPPMVPVPVVPAPAKAAEF